MTHTHNKGVPHNQKVSELDVEILVQVLHVKRTTKMKRKLWTRAIVSGAYCLCSWCAVWRRRVMVQKWPNSMKSIIFPTPNLEMFFNKLRDTWQSGPNSIWPCTKWNFRRVEKAAFPCYRHTYEDEKNYSKLFEKRIYFRSLLLMVFFFLHIYKIYLESWWIVENPTMWPTFIRVHYL